MYVIKKETRNFIEKNHLRLNQCHIHQCNYQSPLCKGHYLTVLPQILQSRQCDLQRSCCSPFYTIAKLHQQSYIQLHTVNDIIYIKRGININVRVFQSDLCMILISNKLPYMGVLCVHTIIGVFKLRSRGFFFALANIKTRTQFGEFPIAAIAWKQVMLIKI